MKIAQFGKCLYVSKYVW